MNKFGGLRRIQSLLGAGLLISTGLCGETMVLNPVEDATIYSESENANGTGDLIIGHTQNNGFRRSLLRFDFSEIPTGAEIQSVELKLLYLKGEGSLSGDSQLHRITTGWSEGTTDPGDPSGEGDAPAAGDVTFNFATYETVAWTNSGGDFEDTASGSISGFSAGYLSYSGPGMLRDVEYWMENPEKNYGWMLRGDEENLKKTLHFFSREAPSPLFQPQLTVEYSEGMVGDPELELIADKDATIFLESDNADGAGNLRTGLTNKGVGNARRALLAFDFQEIPVGSRVTAAEIELTLLQSNLPSGEVTLSLHSLEETWGEGGNSGAGQGVAPEVGDVTASYRFFDSLPWLFPGGDFEEMPEATFTLTEDNEIGSAVNFSSEGIIESLQHAVNLGQPHNGFILLGDETIAGATFHFGSREDANDANRPRLRLTYVPDSVELFGGYEVDPETGYVNTGKFLGWLDVAEAPHVWSYAFNKYLFAPEELIGPGGGWVYVLADTDLSVADPEDNRKFFGYQANQVFDVNTGDGFLKWVNTQYKPWVYSYSTGNWFFIDETIAGDSGLFIYFFR